MPIDKKLPDFLQQPEYRQSEDQNSELSNDLTAMYAQMVLRNKRFKPSFPVREESVPSDHPHDERDFEPIDAL